MQTGELLRCTLAAILLAAGLAAGQVSSNIAETIIVPGDPCRPGESFTYQRTLREKTALQTRFDVQFPSPVASAFDPNNTVPGELYLPTGLATNRTSPAVVCLHIMNGNFELERLICRKLAQQGVVALFFKLPYYGERGGEAGRQRLATSVDMFIEGLEQGFADAGRAFDLLQAMPEVDPAHLGITGISLGAIEAAIVSGRDSRVNKACLMLGGGDLVRIIREARETRRMRTVIETFPPADQQRAWDYLKRIDPVNSGPSLRRMAEAGNLRMVCADEDQVIPPAAGRRLAEAAGFADGITWLEGLDHYSALARLPQILDDLTAFFATDVPADWTPPVSGDAVRTPMDLLGLFLRGVTAFGGGGADPSGAHLVGADIEFMRNGSKETARFDFARGPAGRFRLTAHLPQMGKFGMGQDVAPWLLGANETIFSGEAEGREGQSFSQFVSPDQRMRYQVALGALTAASMAPAVLSDYCTLVEKPTAGKRRTIQLRVNPRKAAGVLEMVFAHDDTPVAASWDIGGTTGKATFRYWQIDAVMDAAAFEAPTTTQRKVVRQEDLLRMFAAVAEYLLEMTE